MVRRVVRCDVGLLATFYLRPLDTFFTATPRHVRHHISHLTHAHPSSRFLSQLFHHFRIFSEPLHKLVFISSIAQLHISFCSLYFAKATYMKTCESTTMNPALPTLYFSHFIEKENEISLQTLPPELLHRCIAQFADWGDLAKLACVQKSWKNLVGDAAEFGGRDAKWELSMLLLGDSIVESSDQEANVSNERSHSYFQCSRGLAKNEALAIQYLTELSGVDVDNDVFAYETDELNSEHDNSSLPKDWTVGPNTTADESALLALAKCHLTGIGGNPNPKLALHYLQAAYHYTNSVQSAHTLALLYEYPKESNNLVQIDVYAAFEWFKAAAELGHVSSMAELALCYELGCGTAQNDNAALDWYTKAANHGHGSSHYSVGEHYEEARGVPLDHEEACLWYHRAAVMGEQDGVSGLKRLRQVARRVLSANNLQELAEQHELDEILHE